MAKTSTRTKSPSNRPDATRSPRMTVYALRLKSGGERRVTVPTAYKLTFGPTVPYLKHSSGAHGDGTWALRFYDGNNLKCIFTDVSSFRDMSIQVLEKRTRSKRQTIEKAAKYGGRSAVVEATIETWVDPDSPDEANETDEQFLLAANGEFEEDL